MVPFSRTRLRNTSHEQADFLRGLRWAVVVGALIFVAVLWNFGPHPLRTALPGGAFSGFYDDQAASLLDGRLDLDPGDAGIEAFVIDGKEYLYFPPGPAIVRMPLIAISESRFEGRLTAPAMLIAWLLIAAGVSRLLWLVRGAYRPTDAPVSRFERYSYGTIHLAVCAGSVVLFLASLPWVYHEAYMWSIAAMVWAMVWMIRLFLAPSMAAVGGFGCCVLAAVLVRATAGWALGATAVALAVWLLRRSRQPDADGDVEAGVGRLALATAFVGLVPLALGIAINWAKFEHPYLFPLDKQVFSTLNEHRRQAIAANGGDIVNLNIIPTTAYNYFRPNGVGLSGVFPYVTLPAKTASTVGEAVIDQSYRTGSVPSCMPLLFGLTVWGLWCLIRRSTRRQLAALRAPVFAACAGAGPVMMYGYLAYRYTAEFMPLLIVGSAIGGAAVIEHFVHRRRQVKTMVLGVFAAVAAYGIVVNGAIAVDTALVSSPGPNLERIVRVQRALAPLTGSAFDDRISIVDAVPVDVVADDIRIVGECEAAFYGTGDLFAPWELLSVGEWGVVIEPHAGEGTVTVGQAATMGDRPWVLQVEFADDRYRPVTTWVDHVDEGVWQAIPTDGRIRLEILVNREFRVFSVEPAPDDDKFVIPITIFDGDRNVPYLFEPVIGDAGQSALATVGATRRPATELCLDLLDRAR